MVRVRLSDRMDPIYAKMSLPHLTVWDVSVPRPSPDLPWRSAAIRYAGREEMAGAEVIDLAAHRPSRPDAVAQAA